MKRRILLILSCLGVAMCAYAAARVKPSTATPALGDVAALSNKQDFARHWAVESEAPDYEVRFLGGDTVEIVAPRGLTLWRRERLSGRITVEYDACLMVDEANVPAAGEGPGTKRDRPSDLNCFWMASDPAHPDDIMKRAGWRGGIFTRCYSLRLYYMGYGGNGNTTTRFRRYDGDSRGVDDAAHRPPVLTEYTDAAHLNVPGRWRHIKATSTPQGHVEYWIDGERLVDFRDPEPLTSGWFGIRTTWSRLRVANFRYRIEAEPSVHDAAGITLRPIGGGTLGAAGTAVPASFGVPFDAGEVQPAQAFVLVPEGGDAVPLDFRALATWPDGSVKWGGFAGAVPAAEAYTLRAVQTAEAKRLDRAAAMCVVEPHANGFTVDVGVARYHFPKHPDRHFLDSVTMDGLTLVRHAALVASMQGEETPTAVQIDTVRLLRQGQRQAVVRVDGRLEGAATPTFVLHLYLTAGTPQVRMVHTFVNNIGSELSAPFGTVSTDAMLTSLGVRFDVPLRRELYNRHVAFGTGLLPEGDTAVTARAGLWHEPVQPLHGRRDLSRQRAEYRAQMAGEPIEGLDTLGERQRALVRDWAAWDGYRLSQLNDLGYTIRKRAKGPLTRRGEAGAERFMTPWVGTFAGLRAEGSAYVGDTDGGLAVTLHDFWQSCPSTLLVDGATTDEAELTVWLWSPEAEPMDLRHYDVEPHGLEAAYEDVQEGMSSPYGIARTSELTLLPVRRLRFDGTTALPSGDAAAQLAPTPEYLYARRAFGVWSLPDRSTPERAAVEDELAAWSDFYVREQDRRHWYGYWHYGDVMHAFDPERREWMYDVGGFAWDNTELASNMMLWYNFLRTGRADLWRMAVAMTRHTSEVDVHHLGPWAGLGSRHNVTHWGCGAKESRISQALWNRFYYYLSGGDDRTGDLMTAVRDADTLLYRLDPMRLAQPRELYPCTAPARLRIGPDWLGYAAGWMTEWERMGNTAYRDKMLAGMASINALPHGIFTGPKALGYDPATGIITYEGDTALQNTNHLLPIMGGFELMNELLPAVAGTEAGDGFARTWLEMCRTYREMADSVSHNTFLIPRLHAYAAYYDHDPAQRTAAWRELWGGRQTPTRFSTNGAATWALDAIYMMEVCPPE